jgi:hypothetical protein
METLFARRFAGTFFLTMLVVGASALPAAADGPGVGTPAVVTVGDSAISGEAGRWAGNTNDSYTKVDALGPTAYFDNANNTAETIPGCHRSKAAEAHIGGGVLSANLACSGAQTSTHGTGDGEDFKPGIDFYSDAQGRQGQALALQQYAATHNVKAVTVLIGANDYGFADIVEACVVDWYTSPSWWKNYCQDDDNIAAMFTPQNIAYETENVKQAYLRVGQAMSNAGYSASQYKIIAQTYWSPLPRGSGFRYPETGYTRQTVGGCGVWNRDADWANDTVVPVMNNTTRNAVSQSGLTNVVTLDMQNSLVGRRLCENTVGLLEEQGVSTWQSNGAVDKTEWVSQVRTSSTVGGPYQLQEDGHASYWGQKAMRNCLRLAYNGGTVRGGNCVIDRKGLNSLGEPKMALR